MKKARKLPLPPREGASFACAVHTALRVGAGVSTSWRDMWSAKAQLIALPC